MVAVQRVPEELGSTGSAAVFCLAGTKKHGREMKYYGRVMKEN